MLAGALVFALEEVSLVVNVADLGAALSRASACRPIYGTCDEVVVVGRDLEANTVTVRYVWMDSRRITIQVPAHRFSVRAHRR